MSKELIDDDDDIIEESDDNSNDGGVENLPIIPLNDDIERKKGEAIRKEVELRKKTAPLIAIVKTIDGIEKPVTELNGEEKQIEIIRCKKDPVYFIETYFTIFDQTQGDGGKIVKFILFDIQKDLISCYQKYQLNVANKYRQAGISTTTSAYIAWYIAFSDHRNVAIVADKLETARDEVMYHSVEFLNACPKWLVPQPTIKDTQKYKHYDNDCQLRAFASTSLRGYTPTLLFWDETAWAERGDKFWTAARPAVLNTGGKVIFVSCVTKDTYIFTNKGIKQIKDFIKTEELGAHFINNINLLGINKTRKTNIIFNNGYVNTLKIKTSYTELESSENHKYWGYKLKDNKYDWYKASELEINDYVSVQKGMNIWGNNNDCSDFKPTENGYIKNIFKPIKITPDIAYLIGLYISEGSGNIRKNKKNKFYGITISCGDDISFILKILNMPYYLHDDNIHYNISSLNFSEFLEYLGFDLSKRAPKKIIPSRLLEMPKKNIVAMLQGIMDGDGWASYNVPNNSIRVGIGLSSKELINQIRIIFNNFGILTEYHEVLTPITERVKVESMQYRIVANAEYAKKYFEEIGFRLKRKKIIINNYNITKIGHIGVKDNIPNGTQIINEIFKQIKYYGLYDYLDNNDIKIKEIIHNKVKIINPSSRKTILKLLKLEKENISKELIDKLNSIVNENIVWTRIKSIEKSKNYTYDFSMSNDNEKEENEFHMSLIYNGLITHQTPNSFDPIFYKTFQNARLGKNRFHAIELWWYNDPRYTRNKDTGEFDLEWVKNKGKENEIRIKDEHWDNKKRLSMVDDGWTATSSWFDEQILEYNGNLKQVAQELLCVFGEALITIRNKKTNIIETLKISDFYSKFNEQSYFLLVINKEYEILNSSGKFVNFFGIEKTYKDVGYKVILENDMSIVVSEDHIFLANGKNMYVKSLIPNITYLTTNIGDFYVKKVEIVDGCDFYDIVDSEDCEYFANGFLNHNCSFLGSGDNFISEENIKRIEENEVKTPIRQEYVDLEMWIWEDPKPEEEYIMILDAAAGHGDDYATINIYKIKEVIEDRIVKINDKYKKKRVRTHKLEQVAEYYNRVLPQTLGEIAYIYGTKYNQAYAVVDITGGYGGQAIEKLIEIGYTNIHYSEVTHKPTRDKLSGYIKVGTKILPDGKMINIDLVPGFFVGGNRGSILTEFQRAINMLDIIIRSIRLTNEIKTFINVPGNRVADHKRSFHDDSLMGSACGVYVVNYQMTNFKNSQAKTKKMLDAYLKLEGDQVMVKVINTENRSESTRTPDYRVTRNNPYGANAWLFKNWRK